MAYAVVGNEVKKGGKLVDRGANHRDAIGAARDRAKSGGSATLRPTAHVTVSLDFDDAGPYVSVVDLDAAQAEDLAGETDPAVIAQLMKRKPSEIQAAHQVEVLAKQTETPFTHGGRKFAAGDWVVLSPEKTVEAVPASEFSKRFTSATNTTKKDGGGKAGASDTK